MVKTRNHFTLTKEAENVIDMYLKASESPRILDAECQYGRRSMEYLRHGLKSDFVGVDIDLEAIRYGKVWNRR